jgi:hypothetical protein
MDVQTLEEQAMQVASTLIECGSHMVWLATQHREKNTGMGVIGRELHVGNGYQANARVAKLARNQGRQITLDLVGDAVYAMWAGGLTWHGIGEMR